MTKTICVLLMAAYSALAFAQKSADAPKTAKPAALHSSKKKAAPTRVTPPLTIPVGAVKDSDGSFHYTDRSGKAWIYHETPFGVSRAADVPQASTANESTRTPFNGTKRGASAGASRAAVTPNGNNDRTQDETNDVTAVAKGDTVRFEKPTPFGSTVWEKNKSALTAQEQKIWEREQAKGIR